MGERDFSTMTIPPLGGFFMGETYQCDTVNHGTCVAATVNDGRQTGLFFIKNCPGFTYLLHINWEMTYIYASLVYLLGLNVYVKNHVRPVHCRVA